MRGKTITMVPETHLLWKDIMSSTILKTPWFEPQHFPPPTSYPKYYNLPMLYFQNNNLSSIYWSHFSFNFDILYFIVNFLYLSKILHVIIDVHFLSLNPAHLRSSDHMTTLVIIKAHFLCHFTSYDFWQLSLWTISIRPRLRLACITTSQSLGKYFAKCFVITIFELSQAFLKTCTNITCIDFKTIHI